MTFKSCGLSCLLLNKYVMSVCYVFMYYVLLCIVITYYNNTKQLGLKVHFSVRLELHELKGYLHHFYNAVGNHMTTVLLLDQQRPCAAC